MTQNHFAEGIFFCIFSEPGTMKNVEIMKKIIGIYETTIELSSIRELRKVDHIFCDNKYIWVCINSNLRLDLTIQICLQFALPLNLSPHSEQK